MVGSSTAFPSVRFVGWSADSVPPRHKFESIDNLLCSAGWWRTMREAWATLKSKSSEYLSRADAAIGTARCRAYHHSL